MENGKAWTEKTIDMLQYKGCVNPDVSKSSLNFVHYKEGFEWERFFFLRV